MAIDPTQSSLIRAVGSPTADDAWRRFDARYGPPVVAFALTRGLQLADAEDVRQRVMMRLAAALPDFQYDRSQGRFRDYVFTIARRELIRLRTRRAGVQARTALDVDAIDPPSPEEREMWDVQWERHRLRRAMSTLAESESDRNMAILRRLVAGESAADIGTSAGMTGPSVRKIAQRLRERLRTLLDDEANEGSP